MARWRAWAFGGAVTSLAAYLIEYFPSHLGSWELRAIHPLYGLAWLGGGELLARTTAWIQRHKPGKNLRDIGMVAGGGVGGRSPPLSPLRGGECLGFLDGV